MTNTVPTDALGEPLTRSFDDRPRQAGADFPPRTVATIGDLGKLLADYLAQCEWEMRDISLTAFWPSLSALMLATMDNDAGRREAMRTAFFNSLAERIRTTRKSHAECDQWMAKEYKRQDAAARRTVDTTRENVTLKARVAELEAELERRNAAWPRAVGE